MKARASPPKPIRRAPGKQENHRPRLLDFLNPAPETEAGFFSMTHEPRLTSERTER
jgi:hypothetical protein